MNAKKTFRVSVGFLIFFRMYAAPTINGQKPMVVVIPSYNNAMWYEKNLESVFKQRDTYSNFRVIYIDDASTDKTGDLVDSYVVRHGKNVSIRVIHHKKNQGALKNAIDIIYSCDNNEIIVTLDGDDWFNHNHVLADLNEIYKDKAVWMTYGQFLYWPTNKKGICRSFPDKVCKDSGYRDYEWISSHLRTFYAALFKKIDLDDLKHDGAYFSTACDLAIMFPMLEMCSGHVHCRCIEQNFMYVHNRVNPLSDSSPRSYHKQRAMNKVIRKKKKYKPLDADEFYAALMG